ncbi:MAG: hypothetical protein IPN17_23515 [Deltaproteobacteria bacterium]|nr:hypothetical protein [Deltaproteobacteria bacterium]
MRRRVFQAMGPVGCHPTIVRGLTCLSLRDPSAARDGRQRRTVAIDDGVDLGEHPSAHSRSVGADKHFDELAIDRQAISKSLAVQQDALSAQVRLPGERHLRSVLQMEDRRDVSEVGVEKRLPQRTRRQPSPHEEEVAQRNRRPAAVVPLDVQGAGGLPGELREGESLFGCWGSSADGTSNPDGIASTCSRAS